ncbi:agamous-like MADS-box protein AGL80 [Lotus japonicus]|uniref:agamous-like MADS-box protein AGL80 n=1 Tax=Lotus japonicus TaxID=34305 RepID=UPI002587BD83|nr:agamous-like MADS-box protein AGL80 [Lotus japonicus]
MTRKKVKLAYISDDTARKATFKKRKKGIIKKASELTILCGIPACAIISNPFDTQAEVWPNPEVAKQLIDRYQNASVIDESKNVNQESFIMQRIAKAKDHLKKLRKENREKELTIKMFKYTKEQNFPDNVTVEEVKEINELVVKKQNEIEKTERD